MRNILIISFLLFSLSVFSQTTPNSREGGKLNQNLEEVLTVGNDGGGEDMINIGTINTTNLNASGDISVSDDLTVLGSMNFDLGFNSTSKITTIKTICGGAGAHTLNAGETNGEIQLIYNRCNDLTTTFDTVQIVASGCTINGGASITLQLNEAVILSYSSSNTNWYASIVKSEASIIEIAETSVTNAAWLLGGNTLGAQDSIGSKDNQNVYIIQNDTRRVTVESSFTRWWRNNGSDIIWQANANTGTIDINVPANTADAFEGYTLGDGSDSKWINYSSTINNNFLSLGTANDEGITWIRSEWTGIGRGISDPKSILEIGADQDVAPTGVSDIKGWKFHSAIGNPTDTLTAASGSGINVFAHAFMADTLNALNSNVTITNTANVYIQGPHVSGTNITQTNPWALFIDNGNIRHDGVIYAGQGDENDPGYTFLLGQGYGMFHGSAALRFSANDVEAMRIDSDQNTTIDSLLLNIASNVTTTTGQAVAGHVLPVDVSTDTCAITPPHNPVPGMTFDVTDIAANASTNAITIYFTSLGQNFYGTSQNVVMNADRDYQSFLSIDGTTGWVSRTKPGVVVP